jgi:hypothetical protein
MNHYRRDAEGAEKISRRKSMVSLGYPVSLW